MMERGGLVPQEVSHRRQVVPPEVLHGGKQRIHSEGLQDLLAVRVVATGIYGPVHSGLHELIALKRGRDLVPRTRAAAAIPLSSGLVHFWG